MLLWGVPLVWLAVTPSAAVAYLALVVVGVGNAIEDVGLFTLLARYASPHSGGSVLGATEFVIQAGLAAADALVTQRLSAGPGGPAGGRSTLTTAPAASRSSRFRAAHHGRGPESRL
jgi:hypothetical protein